MQGRKSVSKKDRIIVTRDEKLAIFVILFSKLSKFCVAVQFMSTLFQPEATPCLPIVIIYWIYCNWVTEQFEIDYINAIERILYFKIISKINKEDYQVYKKEHRKYFELENSEESEKSKKKK